MRQIAVASDEQYLALRTDISTSSTATQRAWTQKRVSRDGDSTKQSGAKKKISLNSIVVWIQSYPSLLQNNLKGAQLNVAYTQIHFCHLQGEAAWCTFSSYPRCGRTDVSLPVPQRRHLELRDSHCYAWHSSAGRPRRGSGSSSSGAWHWVPS